MNLGHRFADQSGAGSVNLNIFQLKYFSIFIVIAITIVSFYSISSYFGQVWQTGGLSIVFVPVLGGMLKDLFDSPNILLSWLVLVGYGLGPTFFYWFIYRISHRHLTAILTNLLLLLPLSIITSDAPTRLSRGLMEKDGAHIIGFTITALALPFFQNYLVTNKKIMLFFFITFSTLIGLISFFSVFILTIFMTFITISEILVAQGRVRLKRFIISLTFMLGLLLIIYNGAFISFLFSDQGEATFAVLSNLIPMTFFLVPVLGIITFLIFDRRPALTPLFLTSAFLLTFGLLHFIGVVLLESALFNQQRYGPEAKFSVNFFIAYVLTLLFDGVRSGTFLKRFKPLYSFRNEIALASMISIILLLVISIVFIPHSV